MRLVYARQRTFKREMVYKIMTPNERAKERGCELPLSLVGKIHGVTRQTMNNIFKRSLGTFDTMVDNAQVKWKSICK